MTLDVLVAIIFVCAFDETTQDLRVAQASDGPQHIFMIQGRVICLYGDGTVRVEDMVLPITVVLDTTAETMLRALKIRMPQLFKQYGDDIVVLVVVNSDSAASCLRLGRHFQATAEQIEMRLHLHSWCLQHMTSTSLVMTSKIFTNELMSGAFCSTVQLHKGSTMKLLKDGVMRHIRQHLQITHVWDPSWQDNFLKNKSFVDMLLRSSEVDTTTESNMLGTFCTKRPSDMRSCDAGLLLRWLPTLWVHGSFLHYCPPGCCSSFEESCWKIYGALEHVCLTYRPKIQELGVKSSGFWLQCRV